MYRSIGAGKWTTRALVAAAGVSILLVCCQSARCIWETHVGYSNGTDAYNGACRNKPSLLECVNCCILLTSGMAPAEKGICVDLCLDQWEVKGESAIDMIADVADVLRTGQVQEFVDVAQAKAILLAATHSRRDRISRLARGLCAQLKIEEPSSL